MTESGSSPNDIEPVGSSEVPLALQLAARVEKLDPPNVVDICEAAVLATIGLLDDPRSQPEGEWYAAVAAWNGKRIRKIMRRGRASAWQRAQEPDGVTVAHRSAEVRAFVPGPIDAIPAPVAKLQIQSTPLQEPEPVAAVPSGLTAPTVLIALTPEVEMSWGKRAAQCAHAGQLLWQQANDERRTAWDRADRPVRVMATTAEFWNRIDAEDAQALVRVHDGGFTEIPAGTRTAMAWWSDR